MKHKLIFNYYNNMNKMLTTEYKTVLKTYISNKIAIFFDSKYKKNKTLFCKDNFCTCKTKIFKCTTHCSKLISIITFLFHSSLHKMDLIYFIYILKILKIEAPKIYNTYLNVIYIEDIKIFTKYIEQTKFEKLNMTDINTKLIRIFSIYLSHIYDKYNTCLAALNEDYYSNAGDIINKLLNKTINTYLKKQEILKISIFKYLIFSDKLETRMNIPPIFFKLLTPTNHYIKYSYVRNAININIDEDNYDNFIKKLSSEDLINMKIKYNFCTICKLYHYNIKWDLYPGYEVLLVHSSKFILNLSNYPAKEVAFDCFNNEIYNDSCTVVRDTDECLILDYKIVNKNQVAKKHISLVFYYSMSYLSLDLLNKYPRIVYFTFHIHRYKKILEFLLTMFGQTYVDPVKNLEKFEKELTNTLNRPFIIMGLNDKNKKKICIDYILDKTNYEKPLTHKYRINYAKILGIDILGEIDLGEIYSDYGAQIILKLIKQRSLLIATMFMDYKLPPYISLYNIYTFYKYSYNIKYYEKLKEYLEDPTELNLYLQPVSFYFSTGDEYVKKISSEIMPILVKIDTTNDIMFNSNNYICNNID